MYTIGDSTYVTVPVGLILFGGWWLVGQITHTRGRLRLLTIGLLLGSFVAIALAAGVIDVALGGKWDGIWGVAWIPIIVAWAFILRRMRQPPPTIAQSVAILDGMKATGAISAGQYQAQQEALKWKATGKTQIFDCGHCGRPLSPYWLSCEHCKATFADYRSVPSGRVV